MFKAIQDYYHWLHGQWPAGKVEPLPLLNADGTTNVPGTYVVGDLTGVPLLKFSSDTGARAVEQLVAEPSFVDRRHSDEVMDLLIIGGGVSGYAAALAAGRHGLRMQLVEASEPFSTIANFPNRKPIYTYPTDLRPAGELQFSEAVRDKESLLAELRDRVANAEIPLVHAKARAVARQGEHLEVTLEDGLALRAHRVIIAIGRSGSYRRLEVPGEELAKVSNRLIDAGDYRDQRLLIVGGGDSALEAAIATAGADAEVTLSYRRDSFSRAKPENIEQLQSLVSEGRVELKLATEVTAIADETVTLRHGDGREESLANDRVLLALGRQAPLDFFRRSKMAIVGESSAWGWLAFALFLVLVAGIYDWKNYGFLNGLWGSTSFPDQTPAMLAGINEWWQQQVADRTTLIGTLAVSMKSRSFYYTLAYTSIIAVFGWRRIKYRNTKYVTVQTWCLFLIQLLPLFLLPEVILPYLGYQGAFDAGWGQSVANSLFPSYISAADLAAHNWPEWGHPRAYWHAYGFILAWPLNVYNVFTPTPVMGWLIISAIQTLVIIPLLVFKYGKGAYCGWICSCGALAETLGDRQRHKMPHGPGWNKLNMVGQVLLVVALALLVVRVLGWWLPDSWMNHSFDLLLKGENSDYQLVNALSWKWTVDVIIGGILGVGLYFKFSGRTWCRFACPLAALMHIYGRFSRFAIVADKRKCISCNQCTSVCHQGIDVMGFASKGQPMVDPQCVRCSSCVQSCPTGTLSFAEIDRATGKVRNPGRLSASPVRSAEIIEVRNV